MANVLDTFIIELDLDPKKISEHSREALDNLRRFREEAHTAANQAESEGKRVGNFFSTIKRDVLALGAGALGGAAFKSIIDGVTSMDAAILRNSVTLNTSVKDLALWQSAAKQAGGSAESITSTMQGMTQDMNKFMLGMGPSGVQTALRGFGINIHNANGELKTAGQLLLEISQYMDKSGMDPARKAAFLSLIPGMNSDSINLLMLGTKQLREYLGEAARRNNITEEGARAAAEYQRQLSLLDDSASDLSRTFVTVLGPAMTGVMNTMADAIRGIGTLLRGLPGLVKDITTIITKDKDSPEVKAIEEKTKDQRASTVARFGSPRPVLEWFRDTFLSDEKDKKRVTDRLDEIYGAPGADEAEAQRTMEERARRRLREEGGAAPAPGEGGPVTRTPARGATTGAGPTPAQVDASINKWAPVYGIDPRVPKEVYRREGVNNYIGDRGSSYGPFQLHYGGMAGGGMAVNGLGDEFTKATGLDARDPSTYDAQVKFSMQHASKNGWGAWHGWRGLPFAGIGGPVGAPAAASVANNDNSVRSGDTSTSHITVNAYANTKADARVVGSAAASAIANQANGNSN